MVLTIRLQVTREGGRKIWLLFLMFSENVKGCLDAAIKNGFWINRELYHDILQELHEN